MQNSYQNWQRANSSCNYVITDVSILTTARKKEDAETTAQSVVSSVVTWSQEWKLNLNAEKSEVCPFSTWSNDSSWNPTIFIGNQKVRVNTTPRLLGVILDRSLTFNAHLKKLTTSLASSIKIIRATAHTSWGWRGSTLKMAFHALVHSLLVVPNNHPENQTVH